MARAESTSQKFFGGRTRRHAVRGARDRGQTREAVTGQSVLSWWRLVATLASTTALWAGFAHRAMSRRICSRRGPRVRVGGRVSVDGRYLRVIYTWDPKGTAQRRCARQRAVSVNSPPRRAHAERLRPRPRGVGCWIYETITVTSRQRRRDQRVAAGWSPREARLAFPWTAMARRGVGVSAGERLRRVGTRRPLTKDYKERQAPWSGCRTGGHRPGRARRGAARERTPLHTRGTRFLHRRSGLLTVEVRRAGQGHQPAASRIVHCDVRRNPATSTNSWPWTWREGAVASR